MWGGRVGEEGGWGGRVHGMVHDTKQLKVVMCQLAYVNKMVDIGLSLTCRILCSNTDLTRLNSMRWATICLQDSVFPAPDSPL